MDEKRAFVTGALSGALVTGVALQVLRSPRLRVARSAGSSIAGPDAGAG